MITSLLRSRKLWKLVTSGDHEELGNIQRGRILVELFGTVACIAVWSSGEDDIVSVFGMPIWHRASDDWLEKRSHSTNKRWNLLLDLEIHFFMYQLAI